jgi:hypothetical protein
MLDLEPLIARLVEDILGAIRRASVDELRELRDLPHARPTPVAPTNNHAGRRTRPPRGSRARAERTSGLTQRSSAEPSPLTEITDPEQLLGTSVQDESSPPEEAAPPPEAPPEEPVSAPAVEEAAPPARSERPADEQPVRLREGERLARSAGEGFVIRRAKRG